MENRLKWAGRVERMAEDRLTKTADAHGEEGGRRRGRPRLRREDCVNGDVRNAGVEGKWSGKEHDRRRWRKIAQKVTQKL